MHVEIVSQLRIMGSCSSCTRRSRRNAVIDDQPEEIAGGQEQAGTENQGADQDHTTSRTSSNFDLSYVDRQNRFLLEARVFMVNEEYLLQMYDGSSYWVYASFNGDDWLGQSFYAFDIENQNCVLLPRHPVNAFAESATVVLDKKLYVIGGESQGSVSNVVHMFDPINYNWFLVTPTIVPRKGALAATIGGKVYVFGGCSTSPGNSPWAELYEPSTELWTPIPQSQFLTDALNSDLSLSVTGVVVFGNKILIRGPTKGIAFDIISSSCSPLSYNLMHHWWHTSTAAVVKNMLVTCYSEHNQDDIRLNLSIRAYDPQDDAWVTVQGLDESFHKNADNSHFMSINGMLVIYHILEPHDGGSSSPSRMHEMHNLTFSIIEMDERCETRVNAHLLWRCSFPIHEQWRLAIPAHCC